MRIQEGLGNSWPRRSGEDPARAAQNVRKALASCGISGSGVTRGVSGRGRRRTRRRRRGNGQVPLADLYFGKEGQVPLGIYTLVNPSLASADCQCRAVWHSLLVTVVSALSLQCSGYDIDGSEPKQNANTVTAQFRLYAIYPEISYIKYHKL